MKQFNMKRRYESLLASNEAFKKQASSIKSLPIMLDNIENMLENGSEAIVYDPELFNLISTILPIEKRLTDSIKKSVFQIDERFSIICDNGIIPFSLKCKQIELIDPVKHHQNLHFVNDFLILNLRIHHDSLFNFIESLPVDEHTNFIIISKIRDIVTACINPRSNRLSSLLILANILHLLAEYSSSFPDAINPDKICLN